MLKKIKLWYSIAETKKSLIARHVFFTVLRVVTWILSPIFAAKVTVALMNADYGGAILNLGIELAIILIGFTCWHLVYWNATKIFTNTYCNVQSKIYRKSYRAKTSNFKITSKEKLLNIIGTDIDVVSNFGDTLGTKIGRCVQVVTTLVIVFISNWVVGLAILAVSVLDFFILLKLNKSIANKKSKVYETKDKIYEKFTQVLNDQEVIKEYNIGQQYHDMYFRRVEKYAKATAKHKIACSIKDNYFISIYKALIFVITVFMIFLVQNGTLDLTLYFTLVPYLLTSVELINEIINISASIEDTDVSSKRIDTILNFTDEEFVKFGNLTHYLHRTNITFMDVSYYNNDADSPYYGELKNVDMCFNFGTLNLIKGPRLCGKKTIFNLLSHRIKPWKGKILLNDIDIFEYSQSAYKDEMFNTFAKPAFTNESILNNFQMVEKNIDEIKLILAILGVLDTIQALPNGLDTNIYDAKLSPLNMFLLGLAMAYLTKSRIVCVYEIPTGLTTDEETMVESAIKKLTESRTLLLFTNSNLFDHMAGVIYTLKNGVVIDKTEKVS